VIDCCKLIQIFNSKNRSHWARNVRYKAKDYIKSPKDDGYRGYHLIGKFLDADQKPMNIEVQLRTQIQHYWATALEIVDVFTGQALKSNQGDADWKCFFHNVSIQFSVIENIHFFKNLSAEDQQKSYHQILKENPDILESCQKTQNYSKILKVVKNLDAYSASLKVINEELNKEGTDGYMLLEIDTVNSTLTSTIFSSSNAQTAKEAYILSEKKAAEDRTEIVALVSTTAVGDIKEVYPNYFADSSKFRSYLSLVNSIKIPKEKSFFGDMFSPNRIGTFD